jgi:type VI secretion system protein VasG
LRTIAATTWREYKKYFETDAALVRRFQPITIAEPTTTVAVAMLRHSIEKLQKHHGIEVEDEAVQAAVELSHRYLAERKLPDKAMSLLDTACAKAVSPRQGPCFELVKLEAAIADLQIQIKALQQQDQDKKVKNSMAELNKELNDLTQQKAQLAEEQSKQKQIITDLEQLIKDKADIKGFAKQKKQLLKKLDTLQKQKMLMPFAVNKRMIAKVLSAWTGIPVSNMLAASQTKLIDLEKNCNARVFGQQAGIHTICQTLMTSGARLTKPQQPLGVFLLVGPSGVGKTETAHQVAEQLLGSADKMAIINMSAFKEAHKASTLTGSPPGYVGYGEGGVLTEAVRREPHSLVLLDEMEKAHPSIQDIFYQMLDRGIMRDSEGRDIDFRQTIIMMTSNAADQYVLDHQQAILDEDPEAIEGLHKALEKHFKPAFLGRVKVIPYIALDDSIMSRIITYQLEQLAQRIQENYQIAFTYSKAVTAQIQQACQLVQTGARQVSAIIDKHIAPLVANALLKRQLNAKPSADELRLQVQKGGYVVDWANKDQ